MRPPTACKAHGCSNHVVRDGFCVEHAPAVTGPENEHDYHREWKKLYNCKRWHDLRDAIYRRDPVCTECHREATTVCDHIIDHRGNIVLFYSPSNLRGVCDACHNLKTGSQHGTGDRTPPKPGIVDGKVVDYGPKIVVAPPVRPPFDFQAQLNKYRNPVVFSSEPEVPYNYAQDDEED